MLTDAKKTTAVLLGALLVASGVAGASVGALAPAAAPAAGAQGSTGSSQGSTGVGGQHAVTAAQNATGNETASVPTECGETPPADFADPESDVQGWEGGYWYNESLNVDQSDGLSADEREAVVARTSARVEAVRCIEFEESVPVNVVSREQFRENGTLGGNDSAPFRAFDNVKFEAMFLVGEDEDSLAVQRRNRGTSVLGFYSPQRDEIVVLAENSETLRLDEITLAHELVHAWQDQQFGLQSDPLDAQFRDAVNARNGIVEGDASYVDETYQRKCRQGWDCLEGEPRDAGELANIGVYVLKFQPYSDGPSFVRMTKQLGGWAAVNALYENPPASTEQVIHPQRYGVDEPTNVTLNDATTDAWSRVRPSDRPDYAEIGEAGLMSMFVFPYYDSGGRTEIVPPAQWFNENETGNISGFDPLNYESQYSTGWDGDRLHVYRNETGELAYVWQLAWDSPQDAEQFVEGYRRVLRYWGGEQVGPSTWRIEEGGFADAFYVDVNDTSVTIVNAPTVGQLSEVYTPAEPVAPEQVADGDDGTTTDDGTADGATIEVGTTTEETAGNETTTTE